MFRLCGFVATLAVLFSFSSVGRSEPISTVPAQKLAPAMTILFSPEALA